MLPLSQRPAIQHGQAYRSAPASRVLPGHRCHYNVYTLPYSRLRCLSFQGATPAATGKQPPSREPPGAAKLTPSSNATSSVSPTDESQATEHGKAGSQNQDAGTTATAAGEQQQQQQQERVQASENASTSGREYWQVRPIACHFFHLAHPCSFMLHTRLPAFSIVSLCRLDTCFTKLLQVLSVAVKEPI
jgi:hypothetical protein